CFFFFFFFSSRRRHTRSLRDWSSDVCSSDLPVSVPAEGPTPLEMLLSGADARAVGACVETLEAGQKQAIALAFFQGLSHGELSRSEERRVGKECRSRGAPDK